MPTSDAERLQRVSLIVEAALDKKAERVVALDVRRLTSYADSFVFASGTSDRHARAVADAIIDAVKARGERPIGVEGYDEARWVLIDLGDVIAHVFLPEVREEYDLERLWSDAPTIELEETSAAAGS